MSSLISHRTIITGTSRHPERSVHRFGGLRSISFPISVVVLEMSTGVWLFDTGVGPQMERLRSGILSRLYPVVVPFDVTGSAVVQLQAMGIAAADVERVILSHFHADHIGGLRDFPRAEIVGHADGLAEMSNVGPVTGARKALYDVLLPDDMHSRFTNLADSPRATVPWAGWSGQGVWQLSSDDSVLAIELPGHARGHVGMLLGGPGGDFHIADAAWTSTAIEQNHLPSQITRLVHDDWSAYADTLSRLHHLRGGPAIRPCHCDQIANSPSERQHEV